MPQLNKKEKAFCRNYLKTGNAEEAARLSGLKKDPYELLAREKIIREIGRLGDAIDKTAEHIARYALIRLAAGSFSEPIEIIFGGDEKDASKADWFSVSEIKKKGESVEIKFFDRFKAVQCLTDGFGESESSVPFYEALIAGAEKLNKKDYGD